MFKEFVRWRFENDVDNIEKFQFPEYLQVMKCYPHGTHKTDKWGHPVYIELQCLFDLTELFKVTTEERMVQHYIMDYERNIKTRFPACSKAFNRPIEQGVTILDMNGLGLSVLSDRVIRIVKLASKVAQDYYPEMLAYMFFINASFMFKAIWVLVKGFIDKKTRKKIHTENHKYLPKLLEYIDIDNLPSILGGYCKCEKFGGCLYSDIGPWNPEGGIRPYIFSNNLTQ